LDPVNPLGNVPNFSRIELNTTCSYSVTVFGSAFCLAQSPLTAPFCLFIFPLVCPITRLSIVSSDSDLPGTRGSATRAGRFNSRCRRLLGASGSTAEGGCSKTLWKYRRTKT
jgi:hypothetical protein